MIKSKAPITNRSTNGHNGFLLDVCPYWGVGRINLEHLSTDLQTLYKPSSLEIVVSQSVSYWGWFSGCHVESFFVKIWCIRIGLLFFPDQAHVFLSFSARLVFPQQHSQNLLCIVEFLNFYVRLCAQEPSFLKLLTKLRLVVHLSTYF